MTHSCSSPPLSPIFYRRLDLFYSDQYVPVNEQYFSSRVLLENYFHRVIDCIVSKLSTAQRIPSFFFECFLVLIL